MLSVSVGAGSYLSFVSSSLLVIMRSSAFVLVISLGVHSLVGFGGGGVEGASVLEESGGLPDVSIGVATVGLIWLIFRSISSIFSWKLLRRSSLADSSS